MCFPGLFQALIGSFSNDFGDGSENVIIKMHLLLFKLYRVYSNLLRELRQNFPGVEFLETWVQKEKDKFTAVCFVFHKTSHKEISRRGRSVTAKLCTKRCATHAKLFFWPRFLESRLNYPPISVKSTINFLIPWITNRGLKRSSWKRNKPTIN